MLDVIIKNGTFVTPDGMMKGQMGIKDGIIQFLTEEVINENAKEIFDAKGYVIIPGLVDMHVHVNDPGRTEWEDWEHASKAALEGGITTIADMPLNSYPAVTDVQTLKGKGQIAKEKSLVHYILWGGLTNENVDQIPLMQKEGVVAFKAFMSGSGIPDFSSAGNEVLLKALSYTVGTDSFIGVHAECEEIAAYLGEKLKKAGRMDPMAWVESRPVSCETEAINRFLSFVRVTGGNGHICHVTSAEGVEMIAQARKEGLPVTFETCASYLTFTQEDFAEIGPILKCAPPLRTKDNREKLWDYVKDGTIPIVTSDHSPSTKELKDRGNDNIWEAWGGISGIQTTLYAMLTEGYHKRGLSLERLVQACCENPAKRLGLEDCKGKIKVGYDADLVILDLDQEWILKEEDLCTKNKISPLIGCKMKGKIVKTYHKNS
ncbi:MAG: allantoinase AllB [Eubacteriales bacterium]|nr:allantoinase AllB [Eubacteriales bacterium]